MNELYARIEALEQLVNQQAASFQRVPSQGFGATDSVGTTSIPTPTEFIWIRITEQPDATHAGYSWEQVVPIGDGTFDDPAIKLTGNNAVTSGSRYAVAYEENGSESVAVDTVVRAWPAYYDADPTTGEGQEFAFNASACAGCADPGDPPSGWAASDDACYFDLIQVRCNAGTTEYSRVRTFNICGKFRTWTGPWGTTNPPDEPA